jgi:glyoxylase I family protein
VPLLDIKPGKYEMTSTRKTEKDEITRNRTSCLTKEDSKIHPNFVDHLVFRVAEMARTERFYSTLLGQPLKEEDYIMYMAGDTRLFFTRCAVSGQETYNKDNVGLNHIAFGVRTSMDLETIREQLDSNGIPHSGIKLWQDGVTEYIWLDDPDGIRVEFWLRR